MLRNFGAFVLFIGLLAAANSAFATCETQAGTYKGNHTHLNLISCHPRSTNPVPYSYSFTGGRFVGAIYPSTYSISGNIYQNNAAAVINSLHVSSQYVISAQTTHSLMTMTIHTVNGVRQYEVALETKSAYAPNGDSGTFVFSTGGTLLSGSSAALNRITSEIIEADPAQVDNAYSIGAGLSGQLGNLAGAALCAYTGTADAVMVIGLATNWWDPAYWTAAASAFTPLVQLNKACF